MSTQNHIAQKYSAKRRKELMDDFLVAFEKTLGVLTPAAQKIGVHRATIYRWREAYPEFDAACKDIEGVAKDFVESKLYNLINDGSEAATIFYMKTKCSDRGYSEKQQLDVSAEVKGVTVNVTSPETAQVLQDIMNKDREA